MQFTDREKQLKKLLKSDKRFLEFLKDKDVNRKKLVDEKGRKMDIKGFVDLKRKYGLSSKDLKVGKSKQAGDSKKHKRNETPENNNKSISDATRTTKVDVNASHTNTTKEEPIENHAMDAEGTRPTTVSGEDRLGATVSGASKSRPSGASTEGPKEKILNLEIRSPSKVLKIDKTSKKMPSTMSRRALEDFKRQMERNLQKENEEEEEEVAEDKIHREFTFTVSGPDTPADEYSDDETEGGKMNGKNKKDRSKGEGNKKLSEAEKADILLLTMDTTAVKKSTADDKSADELSRNKRKKTIKEEVEREVNLEDYQEILTGSRFKRLRENAGFSIDEIKANAVKKRLLTRGK